MNSIKKKSRVFDFLTWTSSTAQFKTDLTPMLLTLSSGLSVLLNCQDFQLCAAILTRITMILTFFACRLLPLVLFFDYLLEPLAYSSKLSILMKALLIYGWFLGVFERLYMISLLELIQCPSRNEWKIIQKHNGSGNYRQWSHTKYNLVQRLIEFDRRQRVRRWDWIYEVSHLFEFFKNKKIKELTINKRQASFHEGLIRNIQPDAVCQSIRDFYHSHVI